MAHPYFVIFEKTHSRVRSWWEVGHFAQWDLSAKAAFRQSMLGDIRETVQFLVFGKSREISCCCLCLLKVQRERRQETSYSTSDRRRQTGKASMPLALLLDMAMALAIVGHPLLLGIAIEVDIRHP